MEVEFSPEPTPEEREALLRALAAEDDRREPPVWWAEGVREAVDQEVDE